MRAAETSEQTLQRQGQDRKREMNTRAVNKLSHISGYIAPRVLHFSVMHSMINAVMGIVMIIQI